MTLHRYCDLGRDLGSLAWLAKNKLGKFVYFGKKREWDRAMACSMEGSQNDVLAGNIEKGEVGHWFWPSWIVYVLIKSV